MRLVAVTGPRQTGKTTLVLQALAELGREEIRSWYVPVDDPTPDAPPFEVDPGSTSVRIPGLAPDPEWLVATWREARDAAWTFVQRAEKRSLHRLAEKQSARRVVETAYGPKLVLVLDEIQRVRDWSNVVKGLWDRDRRTGCPLRVVILGSAPLAMLRGMNESLAGRFDPFPVMHWSLDETQGAFGVDLDEYLFFGGYPGAAAHLRDADRWRGHIARAIVAPVIDRDLLSLTRVEKPSLMRALMGLAAHYSGQIMSYRKLRGELEDAGNTTTVAHYLDLLADAGLVTGLRKHTIKPYAARKSSPKLNVLNTAIMTAPSGYTFEEARANRPYWGRLCESAVGAHLHNTLPPDGPTRLRYWREESQEVDFVLSSGRRTVAIEVRSGRRRRRVAGLEAFQKRFPGATTLVVGTGGRPFDEFLSEPAEFWLEEAHRDG